MAGKKKKNNGGEQKTKRTRLMILAAVVLAALIFMIADPEGFQTFAGALLEQPQETISQTAAPSATAAEQTPGPSVTQAAQPQALDGAMEVYILDVGQGDSIFLQSPGGKTMLIDASETKYYDAIHAFLKAQGVEKLDVVVATHPHSDHIGAMYKVIRNYEIGMFYLPEITHTTATYEKMISAIEEKNVETEILWGGENSYLAWDDGVTVRVLSPLEGEDYDMNNWSIVLHVAYGQTSIMLTGDAETLAEEAMLRRLPTECFPSTVLKMGHHGSSTSTSEGFWQAMAPELVVISVGEGNDYGHPHRETLQNLKEWGVPYYRTDECGTIHLTFDGAKVTVKTEK